MFRLAAQYGGSPSINFLWTLTRTARPDDLRHIVSEFLSPLASDPSVINSNFCVVTGDPAGGIPAVNAVIELSTTGDGDALSSLVSTGLAQLGPIQGWRIQPVVQLDKHYPAVPPYPAAGIKIYAFLKRRQDMSAVEFMSHWSRVHAGIALRHHPGMWRYVQNEVIEPLVARDSASEHGLGFDPDGIAALNLEPNMTFEQALVGFPDSNQVVPADTSQFADEPTTGVVGIEYAAVGIAYLPEHLIAHRK